MLSTMLLVALSAQGNPAGCALADTELVGTGWTASAALQELAEERGLAEHQVGAVAILWRGEACEVLDLDADLLPETIQALERECQQVLHLPQSYEEDYLQAVGAALKQRSPSLVTLAWAEHREDQGRTRHVFLVTDGTEAVRVESAGYGRQGETSASCVQSPWQWEPARGRCPLQRCLEMK